MKRLVQQTLGLFGLELKRVQKKITRPTDPEQIEILEDLRFQASVKECGPFTLLDTARLANLWQLVLSTDKRGAMIEIGSYRGGGALHLSNAAPDRKIWICESFASFKEVDSQLDALFNQEMFRDTSKQLIDSLFKDKQRDYQILDGYFPDSCQNIDLPAISFVHLDVDVYEATKNSLAFIVPKLLPRSLIVLDDYKRNASGVEKAVSEFLQLHPEWAV